MFHGQADCRRFIFMEFVGVRSQREGQVREYLDCHRLRRKFPPMCVLGDSGEDVVPSNLKGECAAIIPPG